MPPFPYELGEITSNNLNLTKLPDEYFTSFQGELLTSLCIVFAGISLVGSLFIIVSYVTFPRLRSFAFELVLMVSLADVINSCAYIITPSIAPSLCKPQAVLTTFSDLASLLWVGSIAFTIHRIFLHEHSFSLEKTHHLKYQSFCWGVPLVMTMFPFITDDYDTSDTLWCWIKYSESGIIWGLVCYYIPGWFILLYLGYVYGKVWRIIKLQPINRESLIDSERANHQLVTQTRMAVYPAIFLFSIICASFDRFYELANGRRNFNLALLNIMTCNLQGLFNSLVYGFTNAVRLEWVACCCPKLSTNNEIGHYVCFEDEKRVDTSRGPGLTQATDSSYVRCSTNSEDQPFAYDCSSN